MVISRYNRITKDMSFEDWLLQNYGTTPEQLLHVALVTTVGIWIMRKRLPGIKIATGNNTTI